VVMARTLRMTNKMRKLARKQLVADWLPTGSEGPYEVRRFEITKKGAEEFNAQMAQSENAWARTRQVFPGIHTGLFEPQMGVDPWMSDTPAEVLDHYDVMIQIMQRGGRVLINGLGLGMITAFALRLPNVTHVDVVELQDDIIKLVGPHLPEQDKLTIHHASAYDIAWDDERWDVAWHDIWPTITPENLPDMDRLEAKYADRVDHQETWVRAECEQAAEQDAEWLATVDAQLRVEYVPGTKAEQQELRLVRTIAKELGVSEREVVEAALKYNSTRESSQ
jgi:hypothetical protein